MAPTKPDPQLGNRLEKPGKHGEVSGKEAMRLTLMFPLASKRMFSSLRSRWTTPFWKRQGVQSGADHLGRDGDEGSTQGAEWAWDAQGARNPRSFLPPQALHTAAHGHGGVGCT